jgi:hypothetical protein
MMKHILSLLLNLALVGNVVIVAASPLTSEDPYEERFAIEILKIQLKCIADEIVFVLMGHSINGFQMTTCIAH